MPSGSPELPVQGDEVEILCGPVLFRSALPLRSGSAPAHVEDTGAVRGRLRELAVAGAGIICSPSDLTYRRALSRIGQARRHREWTMAAVAVARGATEEAEDADRVSMTPVRVAGVLAPLEDAADPAAAPDPGTCLREHREHAGLLTEAGVDMLIVTGMGTVREARAATAAATESGLPIWTSARLADGATLVSGESLEAWREAVEVAAPHGRLVEVGQAADVPAALAALGGTGGALGPAYAAGSLSEEGVAAALNSGASILGCYGDVRAEEISLLQAAVADQRVKAEASRAAAAEPWRRWVEEAALRAPGGEAVWIGAAPDDPVPPGGFHWRRVPVEDLRLLPPDRYRLVVATATGVALDRLALLAEPGGLVLVRLGASPHDEPTAGGDGSPQTLQIIERIESADLRAVLARRRQT